MMRRVSNPWLLLVIGTAAALAVAAALSLHGLQAVLTPPTMDLASVTPEVTILGAGGGAGTACAGLGTAGDAVGRRLAAGDFNGDGKDDLLMGAPNADGGAGNPRLNAGEAYVVFGATVIASITRDIGAGQQNVTILGAASGDCLGSAVAAGDVNGDGKDDIIVGADRAGAMDTGEVYVIFGSATISGTKDMAVAGDRNVLISGATALDALGRKVAAGDLNNDGRDDILAAAPAADGPGDGRPEAGEVYGIFGSASLPSSLSASTLGTAGFTIIGAAAAETLGSDIAVGNVNGGGQQDMLIGADGANASAGAAYLVLGSPAANTTTDLSVGGQALTVLGAEGGDKLGSRIAIGEVNGDGFGDLLISAPDASGPANSRLFAGEAYIIFGSASPSGTRNMALSGDRDVTIYAANADDEVSDLAVGNVDSNPTGDIVFSADDGDGPGEARPDAGEAYIRYSSSGLPTTGTVIDVAGTEPGSVTPTLTVIGAQSLDDFGTAILVADFNGDGRGDLIAGAPTADVPGAGGADAGKVYVLFAAGAPKDPNGDTDGDGIPNSSDLDDDGDGCPDLKELQTAPGSQVSGGLRDPHNRWDYFNPEKTFTPITQTVADILKVVQQFNKNQFLPSPPNPPNTPNPAYTNSTDRTGVPGGYAWSLGPPDGQQTVADILAAVKQFNHNCS